MQPQRDLVLMSAALSLIGYAPLSCKVWAAFFQKAGNSTNFSESHPRKLQAALWKHVCRGSSQGLFTCSRRGSHTKGLRPQQVRGPAGAGAFPHSLFPDSGSVSRPRTLSDVLLHRSAFLSREICCWVILNDHRLLTKPSYLAVGRWGRKWVVQADFMRSNKSSVNYRGPLHLSPCALCLANAH